MRIDKFTNYHYVIYWNLFAEHNQELFATLTGELDETGFNESALSSTRSSDSSVPPTKEKRKIWLIF
jgi:Cu2+-containing amine oxidase